MTVEAVYIGPKQNGDYWVNVKNANPTGAIGDGGFIRTFSTKQDAKDYTAWVNKTNPSDEEERKMYQDKFEKSKPQSEQPKNVRHEGDVFVKSDK